MNRIPDRLTRRIDRLAGRVHRFHRYAHHPLCEAYAGEVLRLGRVRLCKGCTYAVLGACLGLLLGALVPVLPIWGLGVLASVALAWGCAVTMVGRVRRLGKGATRLLPTFLAVFLMVQGLWLRSVDGLLLATGCGVALLITTRIYRRRGPWREHCEDCPHKDARPCPGFRPQFHRERAFGRLAARMLGADRMGLPGL